MSETPSSGQTSDSRPEWLGKTAVVGAVVAGLALGRGKGVGLLIGGMAAAAGLKLWSGRKKSPEQTISSLLHEVNVEDPPENPAQQIPGGTENKWLDSPALVEPVTQSADREVREASLLQQMLNPPILKLAEEEKLAKMEPVSEVSPEDFAHLMGPLIWESGPDLQSLSYSESETVWYGLHNDPAALLALDPHLPAADEKEIESTVLLIPSQIEPETVGHHESIEVVSDEPLVEKLSAFLHAEDTPATAFQVEPIIEENPFKVYPKQDDQLVIGRKRDQKPPTPRSLPPYNSQLIRLLPVEDVAVKDVGNFEPFVPRMKMEPFAPGRQPSKEKNEGRGWWWMTAVILLVAFALVIVWWQDRSDESWSLPFVGDTRVADDAFGDRANPAQEFK